MPILTHNIYIHLCVCVWEGVSFPLPLCQLSTSTPESFHSQMIKSKLIFYWQQSVADYTMQSPTSEVICILKCLVVWSAAIILCNKWLYKTPDAYTLSFYCNKEVIHKDKTGVSSFHINQYVITEVISCKQEHHIYLSNC